MSQPGPSTDRPPVRRARHLLDPDDLRPRPSSGGMSIGQVQKWVMSVLAVSTIMHLGIGVAVAAYLTDESRLDARIGLNVIAGVIGVTAVCVGRFIHGHGALSWWLLLGPLPGLVGAWFTFR